MPTGIPDIDLDALAGGYAHRPPSAAALARAASAVEGLARGSWALDAGGGPGSHAGVWAGAGIRAVVLDPGSRMMALARVRPGVFAVRGASQRMPFRSGTFSLVYFHLSIHYGDWRLACAEALRVLVPSGAVHIWTLGPRHHDESFLARWFPRVAAIDRARFPDPDLIELHLRDLGASVRRNEVVESRVRKAGEWAEAVQAGFVSTLQLLTPAELESGLHAFRRSHADPGRAVEYTMRFDHLTATR